MSERFRTTRKRLYAAHDEDPNKHTTSDGKEVPYETHYAEQMEHYLTKRASNPSEVLKLACCGQHFRRTH